MGLGNKRVLVTGAAGHIGRKFVEHCGSAYDLRLMDKVEIPEAPAAAETVLGSVADPGAVAAAMQGVDAVVHLAADASPRATWESVLENNISGAQNIFSSALEAGVRRVVFASSSHTCAGHIREFDTVGPDAPVRPDCLYGVSKVFGEALGRYYSDRHGLSVVCLRIGACHGGDDHERRRMHFKHMLTNDRSWPYRPWQNVSIWISNRDVAHLIQRAIEADIQFGIFYGASDHDPAVFDLSETKRLLGFEPKDRAQDVLGEPYGPAHKPPIPPT